jgi:hypothetical protein
VQRSGQRTTRTAMKIEVSLPEITCG